MGRNDPSARGAIIGVFSPRETAARLPYAALADAIREVALARPSGAVHAPPRLALPLPNRAFLLVMPASDEDLAITKLVTVHPENPGHGRPTIQGEVVVMEASKGTRLGLLDGATVTARRTAALSLLAAREFAPRPNGPLLIVGAGAQGRSHLEAFREGLGVSKVFVASRTPAGAESLAARAEDLGMEATVVADPGAALAEVSLVVTATTSRCCRTRWRKGPSWRPWAPSSGGRGVGPRTGLRRDGRRGHDGGGEGRGRGFDPGREDRLLPVDRRHGTRRVFARTGPPIGHGSLQERWALSVGPGGGEDGLPALTVWRRTPRPAALPKGLPGITRRR